MDKELTSATAKQLSNMKAPDRVPTVRTTIDKRDFNSKKITCKFCVHYKEYEQGDNGYCEAKDCSVKSSKRRSCKKGKVDPARFHQEMVAKQTRLEENPLIVYKQTEAFYERQYQKPERWGKKKNDTPSNPE